MRQVFVLLLATLGLATACGQKFDNADASGFAKLIESPNVVVLDVRTAEEFSEGHIEGAINIDQAQNNFIELAKSQLPSNKTIAIYCRGGRRSASAAGRLVEEGFKCVNLEGGILAWQKDGKPVTNNLYEIDTFQTKSGKTLKFHALVHASIRIEYDGKQIQIDPVSRQSGKTIDYAAMPKADYIFLTHEHRDHFDPDAIKQLSDKKTQLVTNKRCADMLGFGKVMANGDKMKIADDFIVEAVPAYNITPGHLQFHPKGRDNGFILTIDGLRIYIAGDTEDIPEMKDIKNIDIAFLPCNQPYTMTPQQLVNAAKIVKPKVLFPYHYGQTNIKGIPAQLQNEGIDVRIRHYE